MDTSAVGSGAAERGEEYLTLDALCEIAKLLTGASDPIARMPSVFGILSSFMGLQHGALALLQEGPQSEAARNARHVNPYTIAATATGAPAHPSSCRAIPPQVARHVFRNGVSLVSCDIADEFGADALPPGLEDSRQALIAVPIRDQANSPFVLGVLCAYRGLKNNGARHLDSDQRVLNMVAAVLEQSIRFRRLVARDRDRIVQEAREAIRMAAETTAAPEVDAPAEALEGIIGASPAIRRVIGQIRKVAGTHTPVLLRGESGTGKEVFARALHRLSERRDKPFIKVNCAALSQSLLESELFGHEKGSFTGAVQQKKGRFELADGGTLFLDEIGEISLEFQAKLLRILQEGEFERVGGSRTLRVDVRLVTATNKDLERAVANGSFRADLYFRICVVPIVLPPLRDRKEDIGLLAQGLLDRFNKRNGMKKKLHPSAVEALAQCNFPGNVRELENCIARVAALSTETVIHADDLACHHDHCLSADLWRLQSGTSSPVGGLAQGPLELPVLARRPNGTEAPATPVAPEVPALAAPPTRPALADSDAAEREALIEAMERAGWVQAKAARLLGQTPRQVGYALKKHNIRVEKF
ncbi:nif-specific transcriptional activator NifA [Cereibacter sphaeroides]|uniref:nif-specific transcriptional activator NifA n=1 Tax=Cereibacter sphaeroides TaxID=1063 RepID=UPI001F242360|nr:nif-specific transcriptional activator NifA [Cereibacter sphaeroides]MCE6958217.1 nif-specific transcriptional activator NifA [Cereibacter sphaeroides]MCE6967696.1 nif-specific transcriptional activator NifA [Cereibacter sphaeroides]MCE6972507.1 nif-specific transcriptional activator NifA [Cereibacter sphaeroides]